MHTKEMAMTVSPTRSHRVAVPAAPAHVNGHQVLHLIAHQSAQLGCHAPNQFTPVK